MTPHLQTILSKMCDIVGVDFNTIDFKKYGWFYNYSWTIEQEKLFKSWLFDYLMKHKTAQKDLWGYIFTGKKLTHKIDLFVLLFGWTLKNKE